MAAIQPPLATRQQQAEAGQTQYQESCSSPTSDTSTLASPKPRRFRVIIVGAGVGGLILSHALTRAGVDHVVLEKGVVAPEWGASISIWAHGARILSQVGCWEALKAASAPLKMLYVRGSDGRAYSEEPYFDMMLERNGFEYLTMERRDFLRIIHEQHPDKTRILTGKRVLDYEEDDCGVTVKLQDGTQERGDILVGCDGVHSTVRNLMWKHANIAIPGHITAAEKTCGPTTNAPIPETDILTICQALVTSYKSLVGVAKPIPGIGTRDMHWVTRSGLSFLILTQPKKIFFFVNWKLPQKKRWPHKAKWSDEEAEQAAISVADVPITDTVVFGELWKSRTRAHLIGLQEGTFDHWYFGRTVLAGDAVHKVTPNLALGAMCAMESCAVLLNEMQIGFPNMSSGEQPSQADISRVFEQYEAQRRMRQMQASAASAQLTRLHAWDGMWRRLSMRWLIPAMGQVHVANFMAEMISGSPKINFLPITYKKTATYKWKDEPTHVPVCAKQGSSYTIKGSCPVELFTLMFLFLLLHFFSRLPNDSHDALQQGSAVQQGIIFLNHIPL